MNVKAAFLFSLLLFFTGILPLWGQGSADSLFQQLGSASLIVRLPSQEKKINALKAALESPEISAPAKNRLQLQLEEVISETEHNNRTIVRVFTEYFNALPLLFVYDTTHHPARAAFLNDQLMPGDVQPAGDPLIQLRFGRPLVDSGNRPESMVLTDSRLHDLGKPFPKPLTMTGIGYGINKLLAPATAFEKLLEKRVKKLNMQLQVLMMSDEG